MEKSPAQTYKSLIVYQKAQQNTVALFLHYKKQQLNWIEKILLGQLLRSASSIGANIVEGYGRHYKKDYRRFLSIARGSSLELEYWVQLMVEVRPQDGQFLTEVLLKNIEVTKILTALMKKLEL